MKYHKHSWTLVIKVLDQLSYLGGPQFAGFIVITTIVKCGYKPTDITRVITYKLSRMTLVIP